MPTPYVKKLAKEKGISVPDAESKWEDAKEAADKAGHKEDWPYVVKIFKSMMHVKSSFLVRSTVSNLLPIYVTAALADGQWFYVKVKPGSFASKYRIASHIYYWCRRRSDRTYDIFNGSCHGPYINSVSEAQMKESVIAIRDNRGALRVATPAETLDVNDKLEWYFGN